MFYQLYDVQVAIDSSLPCIEHVLGLSSLASKAAQYVPESKELLM